MAGAMELERPSGMLNLANETAGLLIGRCRLREVERLWTHRPTRLAVPSHSKLFRGPIRRSPVSTRCQPAVVCGWGTARLFRRVSEPDRRHRVMVGSQVNCCGMLPFPPAMKCSGALIES